MKFTLVWVGIFLKYWIKKGNGIKTNVMKNERINPPGYTLNQG